jgi:hypothetical protein
MRKRSIDITRQDFSMQALLMGWAVAGTGRQDQTGSYAA